MDTTTTEAHDDPTARIFAMVEAPLPAAARLPAKPADMADRDELTDLPAAWRAKIEGAGRQAFYAAYGAGASKEVAIEAGRKAAGAVYDELIAAAGLDDDAPAEIVKVTEVPLRTVPADGLTVTPAVMQELHAEDAASALQAAPKTAGERGIEICEAGRERSQRDVEALRASGFAMKEPIYERGTMVVETGIENARRARLDYDKLALVSDVCAGLIEKIGGENRRIVEVRSRDIAMEMDGRIVLGESGAYEITETGFAGLVERLGYGGAAYLSSRCPPELRAVNVNAQRAILTAVEDVRLAAVAKEGKKGTHRSLAARVRDRAPSKNDLGGPEVFAAVSTDYPTFDADKIGEAFALAMPADARGTVRYDSASTGTRLEALFHTTVAPEHFVAGEVFRTGIRVRANDSGDGSIVVRAIAFQNLCLNLIIIDRAGREIARLRHVGSVEALAKAFQQALKKATNALAPFLRQWGYACTEDVVGMLRADGVALPADEEELMRGIFAGLITSRRVRFPRVGGRGRSAILDALVDAWRKDESGATKAHHGVTRAAVVNAITRAAQGWLEVKDPWATDGIELDAARLLWGQGSERPAPLAFVDLDRLGEESEELLVPGVSALMS